MMSPPDPADLRRLAVQLRGGALQRSLERMLLVYGAEHDELLRNVLRAIVAPPEQLCADRIERRAAEIEAMRLPPVVP